VSTPTRTDPPPTSAAGTAPVAVPVRHYGRWVTAAIIGLFTAEFLVALLTNPNLDLPTIGEYLFQDFVLRGVVVTIWLTVISMVIGTVLGVLVAVMRLSSNPVLSAVSWVFVWFFRGTPLLVQIIFWGFLGALFERIRIGIPFTDLHVIDAPTSELIGPMVAAILALSLNEAAYASGVVRAGILAVDHGQTEAAAALGFTPSQTLRRVVLPQAMRVIVPPMGNETITMLKSTALVAVIGGQDLLTVVQNAYNQNFKVIPLLVVAALWYLALVSVLSVGQYFLEQRFGRGCGPSSGSPGMLSRWFGTREVTS
jgi:polar amino acid transport system permease protein